MAFVLTLYGSLGLLGGALACAVGWTLYMASPQRRENRLLAAILFFEGAGIVCATGFIFLTDVPANVVAWQLTTLTFTPALYFILYPRILAGLATPLAAPLRSRIVLGLLAAGVAWFVVTALFVWPERFAPDVHEVNFAPYDATFGPYAFRFFLATGLFSLYALAASLHAYLRAARGTLMRSRARAFALAFGARDIILFSSFVLLTAAGNETHSPLLDAGVFLFTIIPLVYVPLLGYGILKTQLFDIDLKLKFTVRQSTIAAVFIAVFFVVSESATVFLGDTTGSVYLGIGATGLLVFALAPLQRFADGVANRTLPAAQPSAEYITSRKFEVYRAAVESALEGSDVTAKERLILDRLRAKLGIHENDAGHIEREVRQGLAGAVAV